MFDCYFCFYLVINDLFVTEFFTFPAVTEIRANCTITWASNHKMLKPMATKENLVLVKILITQGEVCS